MQTVNSGSSTPVNPAIDTTPTLWHTILMPMPMPAPSPLPATNVRMSSNNSNNDPRRPGSGNNTPTPPTPISSSGHGSPQTPPGSQPPGTGAGTNATTATPKGQATWRRLWAPATAIAMLLGLLLAETHNHRTTVQRHQALHESFDRLHRSLNLVENRHRTTLNRAYQSQLTSGGDQGPALHPWTHRNYQRDMERLISDTERNLKRAPTPTAQPRLALDLERLGEYLNRVRNQSQRLATTLDTFVRTTTTNTGPTQAAPEQITDQGANNVQNSPADANDPNADPETDNGSNTNALSPNIPQQSTTQTTAPQTPRTKQQQLEQLTRQDRALHANLRIAETLLMRAWSSQNRYANTPPIPIPPVLWLVVLLYCVVALAHTTRRSLQLSQSLAANQTQQDEATQLTSDLHAAQRDATRLRQATRRAEHDLALSHLYNENLTNSLRSAIVVTDAQGIITGFNRTARRLLHLDETTLQSPMPQSSLYQATAAHHDSLQSALNQAMDRREPAHYQNIPHRQRLLDLTVAPYQDESGAARGLLWVADDVTDAVRMKNQLLSAERLAAVGRLSAQVAHEIRNPLSSIALNTELLEDDFASALKSPQQDEAIQLLKAIASEVERLTEVTEGYLQLARLPHPNVRPTNLNQLVDDLLTMLAEEMKTHGIKVERQLGHPPPIAQIDPGQLRQAMLNVLRNAREAMPSGGTLTISTAHHVPATATENGSIKPGNEAEAQHQVQAQPQAQVTITDTGPGIDPELTTRAFEPFVSTKPEGTGLGLSITQQILAEHGGTIALARTDPQGTRVTLTLPAETHA